MSDLQGKRILFFSPKFFNYEVAIKEEMERQGAEVHLYDERNNPSSTEKILLRKAHFLMHKRINKYYKNVTNENKKFTPDYILFVNPEAVTKKSILLLKSIFPKAKLILYMWDSLKNKKVKKLLSFFDKKLSFDKADCRQYGFIFRPLFFLKSFEKPVNIHKCKYDFSFIGSVHSDRARILSALRKEFESKNIKFYYYLYVPGKLMLFMRTILDKSFRKLRKLGYDHTDSIPKEQVSQIAEDTNYIIDINHPKQIGLTMRTIEMLGSHKKILTTNENITEYDFYNPVNQVIVSRKAFVIDKSKLIDGFRTISDEIYNKYRISEWVKEIFMKEAQEEIR